MYNTQPAKLQLLQSKQAIRPHRSEFHQLVNVGTAVSQHFQHCNEHKLQQFNNTAQQVTTKPILVPTALCPYCLQQLLSGHSSNLSGLAGDHQSLQVNLWRLTELFLSSNQQCQRTETNIYTQNDFFTVLQLCK